MVHFGLVGESILHPLLHCGYPDSQRGFKMAPTIEELEQRLRVIRDCQDHQQESLLTMASVLRQLEGRLAILEDWARHFANFAQGPGVLR